MKQRDNDEMIIGLMGLSFGSANLGCSALAISFYTGLIDCLKKNAIRARIISFSTKPDESIELDETYMVTFIEYHLADIKALPKIRKNILQCDIIFDFTEGDSFSDLYGRARFYRSVFLKWLCIKNGKKLVLGPQTYGPFQKRDCAYVAKKIISNAAMVFSRDEKSKEDIFRLGIKKQINIATDVAYWLPFKSECVSKDDNSKIRVGINVSGLLWDACEYSSNEYQLVTDYIIYSKLLIEELLKNNKYEVYLIPHVGTEIDTPESDYSACYKLKEQYPKCILGEGFTNPIYAKNFISQMDVLIAARMHASIAGFSTGVFTIPFAYSKKFYGYYNGLGYNVLIDGMRLNTEQALKKTKNYLENMDKYFQDLKLSRKRAEEILTLFYKQIEEIVKSC